MKKDFENLKKIFEQANEQLLNLDIDLFESNNLWSTGYKIT